MLQKLWDYIKKYRIFSFYGDVVRVKILPHKTPDVALVEFETATQACIARNHLDQVQMKGKFSKGIILYNIIQGVLCLRCFLRLWKNNRVSRKPCKRRSDLVLNGQMTVPK